MFLVTKWHLSQRAPACCLCCLPVQHHVEFHGVRKKHLGLFLSRDVNELVRGCAEQLQDVLSVRDWGLTCILAISPVSPACCPSPGQHPRKLLGWVGASKALIFWARHSSDHFSRDASLVTSGTKGILGGRGKSPQSYSCKWCTPTHSTPSLPWERHSMVFSPTCCKASRWQNSSNQCCSANHGSHWH